VRQQILSHKGKNGKQCLREKVSFWCTGTRDSKGVEKGR